MDKRMDAMMMEYTIRLASANSPKDYERINTIVDKLYSIKARDAYAKDPSLTVDEHKDIIKMQMKLGV